MTNDMKVQSQRPSVLPRALVGAGVGGALGAAAAGWGNVGINSKYYGSWNDVIKDVEKEDTYVTNKAKKEVESDGIWRTIKSFRESLATAKQDFDKAIPEQLRNTQELKTWVEKSTEKESAQKAVDELYDNAFKTAREALLNKEFPHGYGVLRPNGKRDQFTQEQFRKMLMNEPDLAKTTVLDSKDYKEIVEAADFAKSEKEALNKAKSEMESAVTKLNEKVASINSKAGDAEKIAFNAADESLQANIRKLSEVIDNAAKRAEEKFTSEFLSKCKKPNVLLTGGALALTGALIAYLTAPKTKE